MINNEVVEPVIETIICGVLTNHTLICVGDLSRIWIYCLGPLALLFPKL